MSPQSSVTVVGVGDDGWPGLTQGARTALGEAPVIVGSARHLALLPELPELPGRRIPLPSPLLPALDELVADEIVPIEQATASTSVVGVNWLGRRTPVHCTASGKVILAFGPTAVRERVLGRPLERSTAHTITGASDLNAQLSEALEDGFARTYEELEVGLDAIAAPVFASGGEVVAALDVSGPSHRLRAEGRPELVRLTLDAAADLSRRLGYRGSRSALTAG